MGPRLVDSHPERYGLRPEVWSPNGGITVVTDVPEVALAIGWMLIALIGVGAIEDRSSA